MASRESRAVVRGSAHKRSRSKELDPPLMSEKLNVLVCGSDGSLKSSISELILQHTHRRSESVRTDVINVLELPALFNTGLSEEEVMRQTLHCVSLCHPGVHAFLLIIPDAPLTDEDKAEMEEIQKIFSSRINKHIMILIMQNSEHQTAELSEETQAVIQSFGGRHHHFSPETQVSTLMENIEQMLEENRGGVYSTETFLEALMEKRMKYEEMKIKKSNLLETPLLTQDFRVNTEDDLRIVLLGKTGVGKSATGNTILGRKAFTAEASHQSVTKESQRESCEINGRQVTVVDTPGLFDTELTEEEIQREIRHCISMILPGPHVFLLLVPLGRFTKEEETSVKIIQETFGENSLMFTMVLFTRGDFLGNKSINQCLGKPGSPLMNLIEACGHRYHVFNNNQPEERTQVSDLLEKIDNMVKANGGSFYSCKMFREMEREKQEQQMKILMDRVRETEEEMKKLEEEKDRMKMMMEEERQKQETERKRREEELKREIREGEEHQREMKEEMKRERETFRHEIEEIRREKEKMQIKHETETDRLMKRIEEEKKKREEENTEREEKYTRQIREKEREMKEEMKREGEDMMKEIEKLQIKHQTETERLMKRIEDERQNHETERKKREELMKSHKEEKKRMKMMIEEENMKREEELMKIHKEEKRMKMMMMEEEQQKQEKERKMREEEFREREERYKRLIKEREQKENELIEQMKLERMQKQKPEERLRREKEKQKSELHTRLQSPVSDQTTVADHSEDLECLRIVLIGRTGSGKSATGNTILGRKEFLSQLTTDSVTTVCEKRVGEVDCRSVAVVDTPGLFDTTLTNDQVVEEIMKCVSLSAPGPHVFVIVVSLGRITKEETDTIDLIKKIFGTLSAQFSIVLFTRGDELEDESIEDYLKRSKSAELQKLIRDCGNRFLVFNNREKQDKTQVMKLLKMIEEVKSNNQGGYFTNSMFEEAEMSIKKKMEEIMKEREREILKQKEELQDKYEMEMKDMMKRLEEEKQRAEGNKFRNKVEKLRKEFEEKEKTDQKKRETENQKRLEEEKQRRAEYNQRIEEMKREIDNQRSQYEQQQREREEEDRKREEKYRQDKDKMKSEQERIIAELKRKHEEETKLRDLEEKRRNEKEEKDRQRWKRRIKEAENDRKEIQEEIKRQQREWEDEMKRRLREREEEERKIKEKHEEQLRVKQEELEKMRKRFEGEREEERQRMEEERWKQRREREEKEREYEVMRQGTKRHYERLERERKEEWERRKHEDEERREDERRRWKRKIEDLKREQEEEIRRREAEEKERQKREEKEREEIKKKHEVEARKQAEKLKDFKEKKKEQHIQELQQMLEERLKQQELMEKLYQRIKDEKSEEVNKLKAEIENLKKKSCRLM